MSMQHIRNFCIIAHIDHGKSTLADRLLQLTGTIPERQMQEQALDNMDLERERGITIKSHAIRMQYKAKDGHEYTLNLIDTPGHVDFSYEVSRSLAACEGALLVVDAAQGVEAQTIANLYLAVENDLEIIPVLNKIDLPGAHPEAVSEQIIDLIGCHHDDIIHVSAKTGFNVEALPEAIVDRIPPPRGNASGNLRALIFDSVFDSYRGAIAYIRVFDGELNKGDAIRFIHNKRDFSADEIGHLKLSRVPTQSLKTGEVGYLISGAKEVKDTKVGDTVTLRLHPAQEPLSGYKEVKPMVFSGVYPVSADDYEDLRDALEKLSLNDAALQWEPETSTALGFGFRCGYLGLLHMEIVQERLDREFGMDVINTVPNVIYRVTRIDGSETTIENPSHLPPPGSVESIAEPFIKAQILTPPEYIGNIMKLAREKRAVVGNTHYLDPTRVSLDYEFPLAEIIFDFYDKLKSMTRGYASLDYEISGYIRSDLVKLDILINSEPVDAFSTIVHRDKAFSYGQRLTSKLKELIPRQMFEVAIQAAIGSRIIARTTVKAVRKNVLAKCYGGDITRKRKLLEKQKAGKRRMKQVGSVEIPQEAFLAVLSMDDDK
jgi:GTP-binding protein LepA